MTTLSYWEQRRRREGVVCRGYRDNANQSGFILEFVFNHDHWRIRVVGRPKTSYPMTAHTVHLLAGNYICVASGREPKTFADAWLVAQVWARGFSAFVRTGSFSEHTGPINRPDDESQL